MNYFKHVLIPSILFTVIVMFIINCEMPLQIATPESRDFTIKVVVDTTEGIHINHWLWYYIDNQTVPFCALVNIYGVGYESIYGEDTITIYHKSDSDHVYIKFCISVKGVGLDHQNYRDTVMVYNDTLIVIKPELSQYSKKVKKYDNTKTN